MTPELVMHEDSWRIRSLKDDWFQTERVVGYHPDNLSAGSRNSNGSRQGFRMPRIRSEVLAATPPWRRPLKDR